MSELEVSTAETEEVLAVEKVEEKKENELLLLNCLQYLLRVNGIEKSVASIREDFLEQMQILSIIFKFPQSAQRTTLL